jgi:hypothetical protein
MTTYLILSEGFALSYGWTPSSPMPPLLLCRGACRFFRRWTKRSTLRVQFLWAAVLQASVSKKCTDCRLFLRSHGDSVIGCAPGRSG